MAIFSKKENTAEETEATPVVAEATAVVTEETPAEKAGKMNAINKYVFTVLPKTNKIEARKAVEALYGVKVATVNMITVAGKTRRFGRRTGTTSAYKKAIVTLKPDSKKIDLVEPS